MSAKTIIQPVGWLCKDIESIVNELVELGESQLDAVFHVLGDVPPRRVQVIDLHVLLAIVESALPLGIAAMLDRIVRHATIVNLNGESFRFNDKHKAGVLTAPRKPQS